MKNLILLLTSLICINVSYSQWVDAPFALTYSRKVKILENNTVIAAGSQVSAGFNFTAAIYRSTNGGASFSQVFSEGFEFYDLHFWDSNKGIAVGESQESAVMVAKTDNGGASWTSSTLEALRGARAVKFLNNTTGFIGGDGGVLKTIDGGANWVEAAGVTGDVVGLSFPSPLVGFACLSVSGIYKTTDGGNNWVNLTSKLDYGYSIETLYFIDDLIGFVVPKSGNKIFKTTDGGTPGVKYFWLTREIYTK